MLRIRDQDNKTFALHINFGNNNKEYKPIRCQNIIGSSGVLMSTSQSLRTQHTSKDY